MTLQPLVVPPLPDAPRLEGGTWTDVPGTRCGIAGADIKGKGKQRDDVLLLVAEGPAAGVTTRSTAAAAPCRWTRALLPGPVKAVVVNAGNANAATGQQGMKDTIETATRVGELLGCPAEQVLVCSTGVIGVPLPMDRLKAGIRAAAADLGQDGHRAARAILTTDLVPKEVALELGGIRVGGIAKGSGMIHPDMATMLAFLVTDARVEPQALQALVEEISDRTFNAITVDGDTSTNDTLIVQSTGQGIEARPGTPAWKDLSRALEVACLDLSRMIAADGEGATTLVEAVVLGTPGDAEARRAARAVLRSPLVKSAIHGRDPNWGRIAGALGAAGVEGLDELDVDLAGIPVLRAGQPVDWDEAAASSALDAREVRVVARVPGPGIGRAWGCDLSAAYVSINADYRS